MLDTLYLDWGQYMARQSKEKNYAHQMMLKVRKLEKERKLKEEERYNSLCGPVTVTKMKGR